MQIELEKPAPMRSLNNINKGNMAFAYQYSLPNGDKYRSLEVLGDTNEPPLPKFQDYLLNYWRLPFERKFCLFVWWGGNNIGKLFTWLALVLERIPGYFFRVILPLSIFMTAFNFFEVAFDRAEKGRAFQKVTLDQWWSQVINIPISQIWHGLGVSLTIFLIFGMIVGLSFILTDGRFWREYRQSVNKLYYMPSCITLWEQKAGELIPHNYFRDEFGFERFLNEENMPDQLRCLRFKDQFVNGFDAQTDRIFWDVSFNNYIDIAKTPREVENILKQRNKSSQLETNVAFLEQFQFMSRQVNHLDDYYPSKALHTKQKHHY